MKTSIKHIAIIDDDQCFSNILQELLSLYDFSSTLYSSAECFIKEHSRNQKYDCILSDIRLENMSGLKLQEHLRKCNNRCPLIFITGHSSKSIKQKAMNAGCRHFFLKPINNLELIRAIQSVV